MIKKFARKKIMFDKTLTFKLEFLLALISASRASEMTHLNLSYLSKIQSFFISSPYKLTKT